VAPDRPTSSFTRADWISAALVWGVALVLRTWHWSEVRANDPFFDLPAVDGAYYHAWAIGIAGGSWLGEGVFHNGPLYPYLLGALYSLTGPSLVAAKLLNVALGLLLCHAVFATARRLFDTRVACVAGLLVATYQLSIFYVGTLLLVNLALPLAALSLWSAVALEARPGPRQALLAGVIAGLGILARPNMLLFGVGLSAWLLWVLRRDPLARRTAVVGMLIVGMALAVLPVTLRNGLVAGDWVLVTSSGGMNLFMGNNPDANGSYRVPGIFSRSTTDDTLEQNRAFADYAERYTGKELRPSQVSGFWRAQALRYIRSYPLDWIALEFHKLALASNAFEAWNVRSVTVSRQFSSVLELPLLRLGLLLPFAVLGSVLAWRDWKRLVPVYLLTGTVLVSLLAFFVTARYRLPVLPALAILAGAGVVKLGEALRAREFRLLGLACVLSLGVAWNAQRTLVTEDLSIAYYNLGNRYRALGKPELAVSSYREALERRPRYISAQNNLALAYGELGAEEEAIAAWRAVLALARAQGSELHVERALRRLEGLGD
jgi:4-amino-4-deoxy-L-arabinose transferase-like glycosyltransferase